MLPKPAAENPPETATNRLGNPFAATRYHASQARIAQAKNSKNPKQYENFNSENPSKTDILREERRENLRDDTINKNPSTPAPIPVPTYIPVSN